jgi:Peptidase A4 family
MFSARPTLAALAALLVTVPLGHSSSFASGTVRRVSPHWAGYVATGGSFTAVQGRWVEPRVRCDRPDSSVSFWVGLGGATATATGLEQIGTSADCSGNFLASYSAWYELIPVPATPVELPLAVSPGDTVSAGVTVRDGTVTLAMRNLTTGKSASVESVVDDLDLSSAEWIAEAPSACVIHCAGLPLADFGAVTFREAAAVAASHVGTIGDSGWAHQAMKLRTTRAQPAAQPSALAADGASFTVRWRDGRRP